MVVAAAGAVEHEQICELSQKYLGTMPTESPAGLSRVDAPTSFTGSDCRIINEDMPKNHFAFAFEGLCWTDPDVYTLMLMQTLLGSYERKSGVGGHSASRLCRETAGLDLAESILPFNTCYKDSGLFGVYVVSEESKLDDMAFWVQGELVRMVFQCTDMDLERGKNTLKANIHMQLDGTSQVCEDIGRQLLTYGRRLPINEVMARVDAITSKDVNRVAERIIWDQEVCLVTIGPGIKYMPDANRIRRRTYWHRY